MFCKGGGLVGILGRDWESLLLTLYSTSTQTLNPHITSSSTVVCLHSCNPSDRTKDLCFEDLVGLLRTKFLGFWDASSFSEDFELRAYLCKLPRGVDKLHQLRAGVVLIPSSRPMWICVSPQLQPNRLKLKNPTLNPQTMNLSQCKAKPSTILD